MDKFEKRKLKTYGLFWLMVLVVPALPLIWGALGITGRFSSWEEVFSLWLSILPVLILFLIFTFLVRPVARRNKVLYAVLLVALIIVFGIFCFTTGNRPPGMSDAVSPIDLDPPEHMPARPGALKLGFGILAILAGIGADAIVDRERKEEERRLLETDNMRLQLEALRNQINPHFFLNTLNNIQALALLDPEKASESIGTFSKMMQMILRYGNSPVIPLADEVCFLDYFICLMRLRYTENVKIESSLPEHTGDSVIQPLVLATFVENGFKHGISYESPSFIRIRMEISEGKIVFLCENSLPSEMKSKGYGIGLENVRKRLGLIYGDDFTLRTERNGDVYTAKLILPEKIAVPELS